MYDSTLTFVIRTACLIIGGVLFLLFALFGITSITERKIRAAVISFALAIILGGTWFGVYYIASPPTWFLSVVTAPVLLAVVLFFAPVGHTRPIQIGEITERVDERDVMFSREEYEPGTETYDAYYARRPEYREIDDNIRGLPELLAPGGKYYDPVRSPYTDAIFDVISRLTAAVEGKVSKDRQIVEPAQMTATIKHMARHLGAAETGIARLNPMHVYSHVGRGPEPWGQPIVNTHTYVIAFTLEMDYEYVEAAPRLSITEESAREYLQGTMISLALAGYIRDLGYPARAHISGSNYQLMLPPVAHDAGLGELGRHGYLISPTFGARVRLGAVSTDLPLIPDKPIIFGVQDFCEKCKRCAVNCPSRSIPFGEKTVVRGVEKWPLEVESCLKYWRLIGSDCGLCMKVCPFSHPPSTVHNLIRAGISRSAFARTISVWGEDIFYGKKAAF